MNKGTEATAFELLVANGQEMANQLRHLAENEIDSDSFAVVYENYNGRETEYERPITELAIQAAEQFDALIAALAQAQKPSTEYQLAMAMQGATIEMQHQRIKELEASKFCVNLPQLPALGSNAEWYQGYAAGSQDMRGQCRNAIRAAGGTVYGSD